VGGILVSVNVGRVRTVERDGENPDTAIWKSPVEGRVRVAGVQIAGDSQADRDAHGGPDRVAYAYAAEDLGYWSEQVGRPLEPGSVGENLTTRGVDVTGALIGERWRVGTALFEVAQPRVPCWKLGHRMGDLSFPRRFREAGRPGAYLRLLEEGEIGAGDSIGVTAPATASLSVAEVARIHGAERHRSGELLALGALSADWVAWARDRATA